MSDGGRDKGNVCPGLEGLWAMLPLFFNERLAPTSRKLRDRSKVMLCSGRRLWYNVFRVRGGISGRAFSRPCTWPDVSLSQYGVEAEA